MKEGLINHFTWLANAMAPLYVFKNLETAEGSGVDYVRLDIKESFEKFYTSLRNSTFIDFENMTIDKASELRFAKWSEEDNLWLFPVWIVPLIPEGLEVTSIGMETFKYEAATADNDIRFGVVAYGLILEK